MSRTAVNSRLKQRKSRIGFCEPKILSIVASRYPWLIDCLWEAIQNAIDPAFEPHELPNKKHKSRIDIRINKKTGMIFVRDNGKGVSVEDFEEALSSIGLSQKDGKDPKLGQFGLGAMSPFDKCDYWTFSSVPHDRVNTPMMWTFDCAKLRAATSGLAAPCAPTTMDGWWSTELVIHNYDRDRIRSKIEMDQFCEHIIDSYNERHDR